MKIPRVYRVLQILRPKLLTNHMTTASSNEEDNPLGIDENTTTSL